MGIDTIGARPAGLKGMFAGKVMNLIHSGLYRRIIEQHIMDPIESLELKTVLDLGCGGGASVKKFSRLPGVVKVFGIDYSEDMIKLSKRTNKKEIQNGNVKVKIADVTDLPFEENYFDIVTAFDTVNFWPDHKRAIQEILRVLKNNGMFCIVNAYPKEGSRWHDFVKFKNDEEYKKYLSSNGLCDVSAVYEKNTIIVRGYKKGKDCAL